MLIISFASSLLMGLINLGDLVFSSESSEAEFNLTMGSFGLVSSIIVSLIYYSEVHHSHSFLIRCIFDFILIGVFIGTPLVNIIEQAINLEGPPPKDSIIASMMIRAFSCSWFLSWQMASFGCSRISLEDRKEQVLQKTDFESNLHFDEFEIHLKMLLRTHTWSEIDSILENGDILRYPARYLVWLPIFTDNYIGRPVVLRCALRTFQPSDAGRGNKLSKILRFREALITLRNADDFPSEIVWYIGYLGCSALMK